MTDAPRERVSRQRRYQIRNPDTRRAAQAVERAVASGRLVRGACADCGAVAKHAHHANGYDQDHWLDVVWLCVPCHKERPRKTT